MEDLKTQVQILSVNKRLEEIRYPKIEAERRFLAERLEWAMNDNE